jgi:hypothetical protein
LSNNKSNKNKIYIAILSFNRPEQFIQSLKSLIPNIQNIINEVDYEIRVFDDCSSKINFLKIKNFILNLYDNKISIIRKKKNSGYAKNYFSAIQWFVKKKNDKGVFYVHESDLYLDKFWLKKSIFLLERSTNKVISPFHHRNHLFKKSHSIKIYNNFRNNFGKKFLKKKNITYNKIYLNEGKFFKKIYNIKAFRSFAGIGSRVAGYAYWKNIIHNKNYFFRFRGKEDMVLSFFANKDGIYFVPGSAKIAIKPGLNGYMFLNLASYDGWFRRSKIINRLIRSIILNIYNILKYFKVGRLFKKILNFFVG